MSEPDVSRRDFLKTSTAGASALALSAASFNRVYGALERIGVAFLGVGGRAQAHLDIINKMKAKSKKVSPVAVCDVWDGYEGKFSKRLGGKRVERNYLQGLKPSAKKVGLNVDDARHVTKDYRKLLELKEVDVVCIATPDHWHAKMCIDAAEKGKHVYCEKPMTRTIEEAQKVVEVMQKTKRVMTVGVQSMADPTWLKAHEYIKNGKIGHVAQAQTSYYRNSLEGQWRYYPLLKNMTPTTVDWKMFLGNDFHVTKGVPLGPKMPFDRAVFAQWRCYWPFGGGMFTDLFVHQTTHMIAAMGVRYPRRVVGGGGLYLEYDGRDVPDVATIVADYDEGCQFMVTATMINRYPVEEVIRGRLGTIKFVAGGFELIKDDPDGGAGKPARLEKSWKPDETVECPFDPRFTRADWGNNFDTAALWANFLECVRAGRRETLSTPELGAAAFTTVAMGVKSYREGKVLFWDKEAGRATEANGTWATTLEQRSKKRDKPSEVAGRARGAVGSGYVPQEYQKLEGAWSGDRDPSEAASSARE
jgi:predicted dehydrogenase